jgi:hypothetical protein
MVWSYINLPTYGYVPTYQSTYIYISKIQLVYHVETFDCAMCYNLITSKTNNHNGRWIY